MAILGFPDPVNEKAARAVAGQVLTVAVATLALSVFVGTTWLWLVGALAVGFLARVLTGPTLSPFGQLATRVIAPRLGRPTFVAGAPKRFALSRVQRHAATASSNPAGKRCSGALA